MVQQLEDTQEAWSQVMDGSLDQLRGDIQRAVEQRLALEQQRKLLDRRQIELNAEVARIQAERKQGEQGCARSRVEQLLADLDRLAPVTSTEEPDGSVTIRVPYARFDLSAQNTLSLVADRLTWFDLEGRQMQLQAYAFNAKGERTFRKSLDKAWNAFDFLTNPARVRHGIPRSSLSLAAYAYPERGSSFEERIELTFRLNEPERSAPKTTLPTGPAPTTLKTNTTEP